MNAGVTQRVLGEAFDVVDGLRGKGMAHEFCVQVTWMIRRLQRESEIVHGEHIFKKFRFLKISDAVRLSRGIELMGKGVSASVEVVVVPRFVDANSPQDD